MGKTLISLVILSCSVFIPLCHAQDPFAVSDPRLELEGNKLHIYYDLLNSKGSDLFIVGLSVSDGEGRAIHPYSVDGDIGEDVPGGNNRHIIWDLAADRVEVEGDIVVVVVAELKKQQTRKAKPGKTYRRSGLVLQSVVFPGLGLTRLTGSPHWIRGVAGYACLTGSIVLNKMAVSTYSDFKDSGSIEEANDLFEKSTQQDNLSEVLAYTALGIWIVDFIWTMAGTSDLKDQSVAANSKGLHLGTSLDSYSNTPLLVFTYTF